MALDDYSDLRQRGLDRIMGLSDGVFAFAITLMVLDSRPDRMLRPLATVTWLPWIA